MQKHTEKTWIVVSRYKANTAWTQKLAQKGHPVLIYEHQNNPNSPYNLPGNFGREAGAYFKFIVDFYESLPTYTAFVHDEEFAWHHKGSIVDLILQQQNAQKRMPYENINHLCLNHAQGNPLYNKLIWFYTKFLQPYLGPPQTKDWTYGHQCCAQFILHKKTITALPKQFYQNIYKWIISTKWEPKIVGHMLEWTYPLIFNQGKKTTHKCERII